MFLDKIDLSLLIIIISGLILAGLLVYLYFTKQQKQQKQQNQLKEGFQSNYNNELDLSSEQVLNATNKTLQEEIRKFKKELIKEHEQYHDEEEQEQTQEQTQKQEDSPYEKVMKAHKQLTEENTQVVQQMQREMVEIQQLRTQIEKTEEMQKINDAQGQDIIAELDATHNSLERSRKDLDQYKQFFKDLVNKNIALEKKLSEAKEKSKKAKVQYSKQQADINRLQIRVETTMAEKQSAEDNIAMMNQQIDTLKTNNSPTNTLNKQLSQLEKQKADLTNTHKQTQAELLKKKQAEALISAEIEKVESEIQYLEDEHATIEDQIADMDSKGRIEQDYIQDLEKEIADYKGKMAVRNRNSTLLEKELQNLMKQYEQVNKSTDDQELMALKKDSRENRKNIQELETTLKRLQPSKEQCQKKGAGNWDFTQGSLKDQNNQFQSEAVGSINFEIILGKKAAIFKNGAYIKILNNLSTDKFKSITAMVNIQEGHPRFWSLANTSTTKCADSMYSKFNKNGGIIFKAKYNCNGPEIMSSDLIQPRSWNHLAFVFNNNMNELKLYINGKQSAYWNDPSSRAFLHKLYTNLFIGDHTGTNSNVAVARFRIFDQELKEEDIVNDMNNTQST
jgi:chromosome segregation ATPase